MSDIFSGEFHLWDEYMYLDIWNVYITSQSHCARIEENVLQMPNSKHN